jgi:alkanesulfonate monooxygenase
MGPGGAAAGSWHGLEIFTTCPPSNDVDPSRYLETIQQIAAWSDEAGCAGILVYTDNRLLDPWIVSHVIIQATSALMPLVAMQPVYLHPFAAAKAVATFAQLYHRRLCLNMVAGGFRNDLLALNDATPHDERYDRLVEYTQIVMALLSGSPVTFAGDYYEVTNLRLPLQVPEELQPPIFLSGSSPAGRDAGRRLGATIVKYPKRSDHEEEDPDPATRRGIRIGIIARDSADKAWEVALDRFPEDRKGQLAHAVAMKVSDSSWHQQLSALGSTSDRNGHHPYWLGPFENYKTFCPYLVGSYDSVADEVARYIRLGIGTFILDVPPSAEELDHTNVAMRRAVALAERVPRSR